MDLHLVELDRDHPGFRDPAYRARRDAIARLAHGHREGTPAPAVEYTEEEVGVWRLVLKKLARLHERYAAHSYLDAFPALQLPVDRVPQLEEISARLAPLTGFRYAPVAGLVTPRIFMERLAAGTFLATQYMRHHSAPLYTPEPDVIHEIVGHAPLLADPAQARVNRLFGEATRVCDDATVEGLIRAYWYGLEFGVVKERGQHKVVGAGLLSSFGELGRFETEATLVPFVLDDVVRAPFDPTQYQGTLFVAESEGALLDTLSAWLSGIVRGAARGR